MKNVAKCDTWCELQNPVNHRVFERKLRPRPSGRGHACLGVTPRVAPPAPLGARRTRRLASRATYLSNRRGRRAEEHGPPAGPKLASGGLTRPARGNEPNAADRPCRDCCARTHIRTPYGRRASARLAMRPQVRREHPLSLSISISGGEETYKDSPSNGERTGISPA